MGFALIQGNYVWVPLSICLSCVHHTTKAQRGGEMSVCGPSCHAEHSCNETAFRRLNTRRKDDGDITLAGGRGYKKGYGTLVINILCPYLISILCRVCTDVPKHKKGLIMACWRNYSVNTSCGCCKPPTEKCFLGYNKWNLGAII